MIRVARAQSGSLGTVGLLHSPLLKIRCPHRLEFLDLLLSVDKILQGFPGGVMKGISFPFDEVLWHLSHNSLVQDGFYFILILLIW